MLQAAVLNSLRTAGSRTMLSSLGSMGHGRRQRKKRKRSCHSLLVHEGARMPHARERQARDRLPSAVRGALRDLPLWLCLCLIWQPVWVMLWTRIDTLGVVRQCARVSCASWGGRCVVGARLRAISMIVIFFFCKAMLGTGQNICNKERQGPAQGGENLGKPVAFSQIGAPYHADVADVSPCLSDPSA